MPGPPPAPSGRNSLLGGLGPFRHLPRQTVGILTSVVVYLVNNFQLLVNFRNLLFLAKPHIGSTKYYKWGNIVTLCPIRKKSLGALTACNPLASIGAFHKGRFILLTRSKNGRKAGWLINHQQPFRNHIGHVLPPIARAVQYFPEGFAEQQNMRN